MLGGEKTACDKVSKNMLVRQKRFMILTPVLHDLVCIPQCEIILATAVTNHRQARHFTRSQWECVSRCLCVCAPVDVCLGGRGTWAERSPLNSFLASLM